MLEKRERDARYLRYNMRCGFRYFCRKQSSDDLDIHCAQIKLLLVLLIILMFVCCCNVAVCLKALHEGNIQLNDYDASNHVYRLNYKYPLSNLIEVTMGSILVNNTESNDRIEKRNLNCRTLGRYNSRELRRSTHRVAIKDPYWNRTDEPRDSDFISFLEIQRFGTKPFIFHDVNKFSYSCQDYPTHMASAVEVVDYEMKCANHPMLRCKGSVAKYAILEHGRDQLGKKDRYFFRGNTKHLYQKKGLPPTKYNLTR